MCVTFTATNISSSSSRATNSGRRSDPRMDLALQAKLNNPNISLLDALLAGGFRFIGGMKATETMNGSEVFDNDHVTLAQRKNQLNRRIRHERKRRLQTHADTDSSDGNVSAMSPRRPKKRRTTKDTSKPQTCNAGLPVFPTAHAASPMGTVVSMPASFSLTNKDTTRNDDDDDDDETDSFYNAILELPGLDDVPSLDDVATLF